MGIKYMSHLSPNDMIRIKQMQERRKAEILNSRNLSKDALKNSLLNNMSNNISTEQVKQKYSTMARDYESDNSYKTKMQKLWKKRTNQGYKHIIKNKNHLRDNYENPEDLIVHRVCDEDRRDDILKHDYDRYMDNIEKHNEELKVIYSANNKSEYFKKFEYSNIYKNNIDSRTNDHTQLKKIKKKTERRERAQEQKDKEEREEIMKSVKPKIKIRKRTS